MGLWEWRNIIIDILSILVPMPADTIYLIDQKPQRGLVPDMRKIILAGGCFWGMEELLRALPGVTDTQVGYTGGHLANPTYHDTHDSKSGHAEAVEISFDPDKTSLHKILEYFFQIHDPTTPDRQGNDRGTQYRSAIFYANEEEKNIAQSVIDAVNTSGKWPGKVTTRLEPESIFYNAEDYHQDYLQKNPGGYTCHWVRQDWKIPRD